MSTTRFTFNSVTGTTGNLGMFANTITVNNQLAWECFPVTLMVDPEYDIYDFDDFWMVISNPENDYVPSDTRFACPVHAANYGYMYELQFDNTVCSNGGFLAFPRNPDIYGCLLHVYKLYGTFTVPHPVTTMPYEISDPWVFLIPTQDGDYILNYNPSYETPWSAVPLDGTEYEYGMFFRINMVLNNYNQDYRPAIQTCDEQYTLLYPNSEANYLFEFQAQIDSGFGSPDSDEFPLLYWMSSPPGSYL